MIDRIHHTGFTVASLDRALRFWVGVLGFEVVVRDQLPRGDFVAQVTGVDGADLAIAMVAGPGHIIELIEYRGIEQRRLDPRLSDIGAAHLALFVEDLALVIARADQQGWTAMGSPQTVPDGPWAGTRVMYLKDPDGIFIELMQPPTANIAS